MTSHCILNGICHVLHVRWVEATYINTATLQQINVILGSQIFHLCFCREGRGEGGGRRGERRRERKGEEVERGGNRVY